MTTPAQAADNKITDATGASDSITHTLFGKKLAGIPIVVWFIVGVLILAWWIHRRNTNLAGTVQGQPLRYGGGGTIINITNEVPGSQHHKHRKPPHSFPIGEVPNPPPHHRRHHRFRWPPSHFPEPPRPPRKPRDRTIPPHQVRHHRHWKRHQAQPQPLTTTGGIPVTAHTVFPGSEILNPFTPQIKRVTVSGHETTVASRP